MKGERGSSAQTARPRPMDTRLVPRYGLSSLSAQYSVYSGAVCALVATSTAIDSPVSRVSTPGTASSHDHTQKKVGLRPILRNEPLPPTSVSGSPLLTSSDVYVNLRRSHPASSLYIYLAIFVELFDFVVRCVIVWLWYILIVPLGRSVHADASSQRNIEWIMFRKGVLWKSEKFF